MSERYTVKITPQAQKQVKEIVDYIRYTLQSPATAVKMQDTFESEIASLSVFPARIPIVEETPWHNQGIHKLSVKNYLIYFWINDAEKVVEIIGVVYGRRDQRHQLFKMDLS